MANRKYDLIGEKFNKLTPIKYIKNGKYLCKCDCGNECIVSGTSLIKNRTMSCGCYRNNRIKHLNLRHGGCKTKLYGVWNTMRQRCENQNTEHYKLYGGRGINVCEEWHDFANFKHWAEITGYKPGLTIDRIDPNKGYFPENCKWSTMKEQSNNRRNNLKVDYNGKLLTVQEIAAMTGLSRQTIELRIHKGYTPKEIVETPKGKHIHSHNAK